MPDLPVQDPEDCRRTASLPVVERGGLGGPISTALPRFPEAAPRRRGVRLSFLLLVVLPSFLALFYYTQMAARQYVTTAVVALRVGDGQHEVGGGPATMLGALGPTAAGSPVTQSYGIVDYIRSMPAMADVAASGLDVRALLTDPRADRLVRVAPDAPAEVLLGAWRSRLTAQFELTRGVITLRARAMTPEDSLALAEAVLAASERLANETARRITSDAVSVAERQVGVAEERFNKALAELQSFRISSGVLDPARASSSSVSIEMQLRQELASVEAQAEGLRAAGAQGSPTLAAAAARARALRAQLNNANSGAARSAGERDNTTWAEVLARNEALTASLRVAELHFTQSLSLLQTARTYAAQQRSYLLTYVRPVLPTQPSYPNPWLSVLIVAGCALLAWSLLTLLYHAILDRT